MKPISIIIAVLFLTTSLLACSTDETNLMPEIPETENPNDNNEVDNKEMKLELKMGDVSFIATLANNKTVEAFKTLLPITITMSDYNNNEKLYYLPNNLPTAPSNPRTIHNGDIMLFGSNCLVLFYKTFPTSYSYTKIGSIEDISGLQESLGGGNITVTLELIETKSESELV